MCEKGNDNFATIQLLFQHFLQGLIMGSVQKSESPKVRKPKSPKAQKSENFFSTFFSSDFFNNLTEIFYCAFKVIFNAIRIDNIEADFINCQNILCL